jgi:predicted thioesterase
VFIKASGALKVFSTPMMIGLAEKAAFDVRSFKFRVFEQSS